MTNKPKYTPAPWNISLLRLAGHIIENCNRSQIALLPIKFGQKAGEKDEEGEANANLIATAPELLSALEESLSCLRMAFSYASENLVCDSPRKQNEMRIAIENAKKVIKKAKGE